VAMSGLTTAASFAVVTGDLHRPATFVGVLGSAQGGGAIVGGLLVGRLLDRLGELGVGAAGAALFAVGCLTRFIAWWPAVVGGSLIIGFGLPWTVVAAMTAVQLRTPEVLLGRVAATAGSIIFAPVAVAIPVGAALIWADHRLPLVLAATVCLISAALPLFRIGTRDARSPST
jgi:MFS family permease